MKPITIIGLFLCVGGIALGGFVMSEVQDNTVYYYTVSEALDKVSAAASSDTQESIRMSGNVVTGTINRVPEEQFVRFAMHDSNGVSTYVEYEGPIPDIFNDGVEVVVEGVFLADQQTEFRASNLLAKCPSKYEKSGKREDFKDVDVPPQWSAE